MHVYLKGQEMEKHRLKITDQIFITTHCNITRNKQANKHIRSLN